MIADFPFILPIVFATLYFGGIPRHMCTWSGLTCPSTNSTSNRPHNVRNISPTSFRIAPNMDLRRYFGTITTWYRQYHFTRAWLCHSLMSSLLSLVLAGPGRGE